VGARLGDVIRPGHEVRAVDEQEGSATAHFRTEAGDVTVESDIVIGADGIHSRLRALGQPGEGAPVWSGVTLWRGTAEVPGLFDGATMVMAGNAVDRFIAYPIRQVAGSDRVIVNFVAERRGPGSPDADWNRSVDRTPVVEIFADWRFDWLDVPATIAAADEVLEYPMVDRDPLSRWTSGRTTLLGDAAHAMYPIGSNGASQAIIDARTLAWHLAHTADPRDALRDYEEERRPVTTALLEENRRGGPERVMVLAAERAPHGFADIGDVISRSELEEIASSYKRTAGFDVQQLNGRGSLSAAEPIQFNELT
jgi:2-polyprenyl-6-methoxyphenol hydroxylase-like FAD-dependent oxidoreductase